MDYYQIGQSNLGLNAGGSDERGDNDEKTHIGGIAR